MVVVVDQSGGGWGVTRGYGGGGWWGFSLPDLIQTILGLIVLSCHLLEWAASFPPLPGLQLSVPDVCLIGAEPK